MFFYFACYINTGNCINPVQISEDLFCNKAPLMGGFSQGPHAFNTVKDCMVKLSNNLSTCLEKPESVFGVNAQLFSNYRILGAKNIAGNATIVQLMEKNGSTSVYRCLVNEAWKNDYISRWEMIFNKSLEALKKAQKYFVSNNTKTHYTKGATSPVKTPVSHTATSKTYIQNFDLPRRRETDCDERANLKREHVEKNASTQIDQIKSKEKEEVISISSDETDDVVDFELVFDCLMNEKKDERDAIEQTWFEMFERIIRYAIQDEFSKYFIFINRELSVLEQERTQRNSLMNDQENFFKRCIKLCINLRPNL